MTQRDAPFWVNAAFSWVNSRPAALWLIWGSVAFCLYCLPWQRYLSEPAWVQHVFLAPDWSWFAVMVPLTVWYGMAFRWIDRHGQWNGAIESGISEAD